MRADPVRFLGLGTHAEDYAYASDERAGVISASRAPQAWVKTTCGYCSVGCGLEIGVRDGLAVSVRGDADHPVNLGRLCPKGLSEHHTIAAPGRLTSPLVRGPSGALVPASWDEALARTADGFRAIIAEHGPGAVAVISTGQLVTEEFYALGKLVRGGLGLHHYDGNTTLCMASAVAGYKRTFGTDGPPGCYDDLSVADCILLVGANVCDNHPLLAPRILANTAATVITVDPRVTKTATISDIHLPITPRSDIALLNGMLRVILDEGLVDRAAVEGYADGLADLERQLAEWTPERAARECGIEESLLRQAALAFGRARTATAAWTMGVNHSVQGAETVTLINTLCLITGNIGIPGASPFSITGQCNAMGSREAAATSSLPGYRSWDSAADREEIAELWGVAADVLPTQRGDAYPDINTGIDEGRIKALWVIATNPPVSFPNRRRLEAALDKLELLVVQDGYETPTTERADVVLAAAVWGEKDGTYTNSERRASRVRKAVDPPGVARSDFDIFISLAETLGHGSLFAGWTGPQDAFTEWARVSQGRLCDYGGMTWDAIEEQGGIQWPCPTGASTGTPRLYTDRRFPTPSGRARLWTVEPEPIIDAPDAEFPLLLNTGRTVEHWHTRTKTGRVAILHRLAPSAWVEINPVDAAALHVTSGDVVTITSRRGSVDGVVVRVTAIVRAGEVFVPFHWDEWCANRLTLDQFDPISREPNYKQAAVRIVRGPRPRRWGRRAVSRVP
ncbi:MAG: nitrate reductase [Acidimicrobiales bacterium]